MTLSVHNEGLPIAPDQLPLLFEPFRRNTARSERSKGLGLGLYITEQIVRAHGGRIDVTSTEAHGTTFRVVFPLTDAERVAPPPQRLVS
jgi:signal transduction histidine kinase